MAIDRAKLFDVANTLPPTMAPLLRGMAALLDDDEWERVRRALQQPEENRPMGYDFNRLRSLPDAWAIVGIFALILAGICVWRDIAWLAAGAGFIAGTFSGALVMLYAMFKD